MTILVNALLLVVACSTLLCLYRIVMGPSIPDRVVAFDAFSTNLAVVVVLLVIRDGLVELIDVVLVLAILGFVGTMAVAKYIKKGDIVG
ncbi:MAG: monovalent cation/H+ antiporter complex subunit F [Candidatus Methylomirabilales bacterium]